MRSFVLACALAAAACGTELATPDETTTGPAAGLECLYDGDCGEDARCQNGACVLQCEGADCCMLLGDCEPAPSCGEDSDCPRGQSCESGTCTQPRGLCPPPPPAREQALG